MLTPWPLSPRRRPATSFRRASGGPLPQRPPRGAAPGARCAACPGAPAGSSSRVVLPDAVLLEAAHLAHAQARAAHDVQPQGHGHGGEAAVDAFGRAVPPPLPGEQAVRVLCSECRQLEAFSQPAIGERHVVGLQGAHRQAAGGEAIEKANAVHVPPAVLIHHALRHLEPRAPGALFVAMVQPSLHRGSMAHPRALGTQVAVEEAGYGAQVVPAEGSKRP
jgi:hypothetical protein